MYTKLFIIFFLALKSNRENKYLKMTLTLNHRNEVFATSKKIRLYLFIESNLTDVPT